MNYNSSAPRFCKGGFKYQLINDDFFDKFLQQHSAYNGKINIQGLKKLWDKITFKIRKEVSENRLGVVLNNSMGELKVQYLPYKAEAIDKGLSKPGEIYYNTNILTKGKVFKVIWERKSAARYNNILNIYAFEPCTELMKISRIEALKAGGDLRTARPKSIKTHFQKLNND